MEHEYSSNPVDRVKLLKKTVLVVTVRILRKLFDAKAKNSELSHKPQTKIKAAKKQVLFGFCPVLFLNSNSNSSKIILKTIIIVITKSNSRFRCNSCYKYY